MFENNEGKRFIKRMSDMSYLKQEKRGAAAENAAAPGVATAYKQSEYLPDCNGNPVVVCLHLSEGPRF